MKKIAILVFAMALTACGSAPKNDAHSDHKHEAGHNHAEHDHSGDDNTDHDGHDHAPETAPNTEEADHAHDGAITLSACQAEELGVTYQKIIEAPFSGAIKVSGVIEPASSENVVVVAPVSAVIDFAVRDMTVGTKVTAGTTMFLMKGDKTVNNNLADKIKVAEVQYLADKQEFGRMLEAAKEQLVTPAQIDAMRLQTIRSEQDFVSLTGAKQVKAPMSGYITKIDVAKGSFVDEGAQLVTITSGRKVVVRADVPANHFDVIEDIKSANFSTPYNNKTYSIYELGGKMISKANTVSEGGYTVPVKFLVGNVEHIATGTALEVFLTLQPQENVISLPVSALTEEQGAFYVYKKVCKESYEKTLVKLGESNGKDVMILSGVNPGDVIVTKGAYFVRLAGASSAIPHGHAH